MVDPALLSWFQAIKWASQAPTLIKPRRLTSAVPATTWHRWWLIFDLSNLSLLSLSLRCDWQVFIQRQPSNKLLLIDLGCRLYIYRWALDLFLALEALHLLQCHFQLLFIRCNFGTELGTWQVALVDWPPDIQEALLVSLYALFVMRFVSF